MTFPWSFLKIEGPFIEKKDQTKHVIGATD